MTQIEKFLKEKMYLQNVSSCTLDWYTHALKKLPSEQPTQEQLNNLVISLRESGLKETAVNACARALNCYLKWSGSSCHIRHLQEPSFIPHIQHYSGKPNSQIQTDFVLRAPYSAMSIDSVHRYAFLRFWDYGCEVDFDNLLYAFR